jgi:hypothetical protein
MKKLTALMVTILILLFFQGSVGQTGPAAKPPKPGSVWVFDANDQRLGILLNIDSNTLSIFEPDFGFVAHISQTTWDIRCCPRVIFAYSDCLEGLGDPYLYVNMNMTLCRAGSGDNAKYFYGIPPAIDGDFFVMSRIQIEGCTGVCLNTSANGHYETYYKAVYIPKEEMPFGLPVQPPFKFVLK